ncbi:MAG: hypothetical protein ACI8PZ_001826 [Myxococcota bacterium]|jgi:hypothetical protein
MLARLTFPLLALVALGCAAEEDGTTATVDDASNTGAPSGTIADDGCETGFREGRCPADFSLPNGMDELISLHEQRGATVAVIGSAEF